jgi:hypothetical protein
MSVVRCVPIFLLCTLAAGCAQSNVTEVAGFLADLRTLKVECNVTGRPERVRHVVERQGFKVDDFLPGERYHRLVHRNIEKPIET